MNTSELKINEYNTLDKIVKQLESCNYENEASLLVNNVAFIALKRMAEKPSSEQMRSYVSRSKYQQVVEENKRLVKDLRAICTGTAFEGIMARKHWKEYFERIDRENATIREILTIGMQLKKEGKI
jgi:hypothetical protein